MRMLTAFALAILSASSQRYVTNWAAFIVAAGTALAGVVAWLRLRQDRPKVVAEVAGLAEARLRTELEMAWGAVDRLREREHELEELQEDCRRRTTRLERERDDLARRVETLEQRVTDLLQRGTRE